LKGRISYWGRRAGQNQKTAKKILLKTRGDASSKSFWKVGRGLGGFPWGGGGQTGGKDEKNYSTE